MTAARTRVLAPVLALVVGAVLLWASSRLTWLDVAADNDQSGQAHRSLSGTSWQPVLVPVALGALAAVAAVALARGWAARVVGAVVLALAVACAVPAALSAGEPDRDRVHAAVTESDASAATNSGTRSGEVGAIPEWSEITEVRGRLAGPSLAGLAALALVAAGGLLLVRPAVRVRADDRFEVPSERTVPSETDGGDADSGRGMWDSLDAGDDPTD